jgi:hypothetical protein
MIPPTSGTHENALRQKSKYRSDVDSATYCRPLNRSNEVMTIHECLEKPNQAFAKNPRLN